MSVHTYVGARYVPRFCDTYDATQAYEALDVVDNGMGTSYIAKIPTPPGTPLTDTTHWALYGSTSGAIINLQNQIDAINANIITINGELDPIKDGNIATVESFGAVGDGVTDDTAAIQDALDSSYDTILFTGSYLVKTDSVAAPLTDGQDPSYCAVKTTSAKKLIFSPKSRVKGYNALTAADEGTDAYFISAGAPLEVIGLNYNGQRPTYRYQYGIQFNASDCILRECSFSHLGGSIAVFNGQDGQRLQRITVNNVMANDVGNTMFFAWCDFVDIDGMTILEASEGFDFDKYSTNINISNIRAKTTRGGGADALIEINGSKKITISDVICSDFCDGILLNGKTVGGTDYITEDVTITNCLFEDIDGYGLVCGNQIPGQTEVENVRISNMTVKNASLAGFEIVGSNVWLDNCAAIGCTYQALYIATKASNVTISNFYSFANYRGLIYCNKCSGMLTLENIYDSEAYNTNDHPNEITNVSNLRIHNLKVMHDSSFSAANNRMFYISAAAAWVDGFITSMLNTARVVFTASTPLSIVNSAINDGALAMSSPNIIYTTEDFANFSSGVSFETGTIVICRPSAANTTMHICTQGNRPSGTLTWKTITLT